MKTNLLIVIGGAFLLVIFLALEPNARAMAVGIVFGALAGLPAALLVLAASRRPRTGWALDAEEDEVEVVQVTVQGQTYQRISVQGAPCRMIDHPMLRALPAPSKPSTAIQPYYIDPEEERRRLMLLTSPEALAQIAEEDGDVGEWEDEDDEEQGSG